MYEKGNIPWLKGKKHSKESKRKISEAHKDKTGRKHSEETKRKWSESRRGEGNAMFGRHHSEETKRKIAEVHKGSKNHNWNGGQYTCINGYVLIKKHDHPFANGQKYIKRSRLVMEKHLGRYLEPKETVHHKNEIRDDDRIENLSLFSNCGKHTSFHHYLRKQNFLKSVIN